MNYNKVVDGKEYKVLNEQDNSPMKRLRKQSPPLKIEKKQVPKKDAK